MKKFIYDIELDKSHFGVGFMNIKNKKVKQFNLHKDGQLEKLKKYLKKHQPLLIGFNSLNFDDMLLHFALKGKSIAQLYDICMSIIDEGKRRYQFENINIQSIDLMEVAPSQAGLKLYGSRLMAKKLQDMPEDYNNDDVDWDGIMQYNVNDLELTLLLYKELEDALKLRRDLAKEYDLSVIDVLSKSDAQIAEYVFKNLLEYKKPIRVSEVSYEAPAYTMVDPNSVTYEVATKFNGTTFKINQGNGSPITPDWIKANDKVTIDGVDYTIGLGGLHSNEKSVAIKPQKGYVLANADISSMYPSLIINSGLYPTNFGEKWREVYTKFRDERLKLKPDPKQKKRVAMLKIFLNGTYGKLGSVYSVLYAPHLLLNTTLTGQLTLLQIIEELGKLNDVKVVSANTDGLEYVCKKQDFEKCKKLIDDLGKKANLIWEHATYKALYSRDVNSYIAIYDGYAKRKGFFAKPNLSKNVEYPIVLDAIEQFLLNGTDPKETINNCKDIAMFCSARKVTGGAFWDDKDYSNTEEYNQYIIDVQTKGRKQNKALEKRNLEHQKKLMLNDENVKECYLGKVVRWYYAKGGKPIYYVKSGNKVPKTDGCKPMMELSDTIPNDLDYEYYYSLVELHLSDVGV